MLSKDNAIIIVDNFINKIIEFLDTNNYNILNNMNDNINYIMSLIGYYDLTNQLNTILNNPKIQSNYNYINIYFDSILMATLKKNNNIIDMLKNNNINIDDNIYANIVTEQLKYKNSDIQNFISKISSL